VVERVPVDSHQKVTVVRDGKNVTLDVVAKAMPSDAAGMERSAPAAEDSDSPAGSFKSSMLGLEVTDVTADDAESLGFKGHSGVLIAKVSPDSPAAAQGLRPGMLITKVDKKSVKNVEEFEAALKHESLKDGVLLWVRSKTGNQLVVVQDSQQ
jgi:serine protease Do